MKNRTMPSYLTRTGVTSAGREVSRPVHMAPPCVSLAKSLHCWAVLLAGGDGTRLQRLTIGLPATQGRSNSVAFLGARACSIKRGNGFVRFSVKIEPCSL